MAWTWSYDQAKVNAMLDWAFLIVSGVTLLAILLLFEQPIVRHWPAVLALLLMPFVFVILLFWWITMLIFPPKGDR